MKHPQILLRTLQSMTAILMVAIIIFVMALLDIFPANLLRISGKHPAQLEVANQKVKIKRPKVAKNISVQEYLQKGDQAKFNNDLNAAIVAYQKASEIDPREISPYEKIGDIYILQRDYASAKENFELGRAMDSQNANLTVKIARCLLGLRKILPARIELQKIEPPTQPSLYYSGIIAAFLNEQETAKDLLAKSVTAGPDDILKANAQRIFDVYKLYEVARDSEAEFLQAMLAQAFDQNGEYGLAIELAFNALKTKHDYRDVWIILGHAFLNEQKWFDAQDALDKAIALDASHPSAYFFRGLAFKSAGKPDKAMPDFRKAIELGWKPVIIAKQEIADIYFDSKDFANAFLEYREIVLADSADINLFVRPMALAINHINKPDQAMELAKKAFETHKNTAMAYNLLGWAFMAKGDTVNAMKNLNEAVKKDPELSATYLNLGMLYQKLGGLENARKNYEKAVSLSAKHGDKSIGDTATALIDRLNNPQDPAANSGLPGQPVQVTKTPLSSPQTEFMPSLSLQ